MTLAATENRTDYLRALPGDDVRQILWRFADRFDLQMLVQSVRAVARGPVARLVAQGARNTHEWTPEKNALLQAFDESGITGVFMEPSQGGFIEGPEEPGAGAGGVRIGLGGCRRRHRQSGRMPGAFAHPRARNRRTARLLYEPLRACRSRAKTASPGAAPSASPNRSPMSASIPACWAAKCGWPNGKRAKSRCCRWRSAAASSPTWASPTSSPRRWSPTTRASKAPCMVDPGRDRPRHLRPRNPHPQARPPAFLHLATPFSTSPCRPAGSSAATRVKDGVIVPRYSHGEVIEAVFRRTRVTRRRS